MKICHISDIHFRPLSRHEEYKETFTNAFKQIRTLHPDIIVITGDIFDTKTQGISPEVIDLMVWWFNGLADICPVHAILGNHDGNLSNASRQDAISPLVSAIDRDDIFLYKKSGVYDIGAYDGQKYNLCIFSCFDEQGWSNVSPVSGAINVALFHGSVKSAVTDVGFELQSDVNVSFFDGYDFVLLGDIHQMQHLAYRDSILPIDKKSKYSQHKLGQDKRSIVVKQPWISYSGSAIQQNFGEKVGKGFLLWDIKSRDSWEVDFYPIKHTSPFLTFSWAGDVKRTLKEIRDVRGARLRVQTEKKINQQEIKQLVSELKESYGVSEVVFKNDYTIDGNTLSATNLTFQKDDLRNLSVLLKLFHGFIKKSTFNSAEWKRFDELVEKCLKEAVIDDNAPRNIKWSIEELKFDNTWAYGKGNKIDFSKLEGIAGIFGPNRSGKSSIIGTIMYALFNDTDRGAMKNLHVINARKGHALTGATVRVGDKKYLIERQSVKKEDKKGNLSAVTSLNLFLLDEDNNKIQDLNGEQRNETEKRLRSLIGTSDDCMLTGFALQGDMNRLIDAGSTQRDKIITRFLDLEIFDRMLKFAKEDAADVKALIKAAPDVDYDTCIDKNTKQISEYDQLKDQLKQDLDDKRRQFNRLRDALKEKSSAVVVTEKDIRNARKIVAERKALLASIDHDIEKNDATFDKATIIVDKAKQKYSLIQIEDLKNELRAYQDLRVKMNELKHALDTANSDLSRNKKSVLKLLDVPCGDQFPQCKYIKDSHRDKAETHNIEKRAADALQSFVVVKDEIDKIKCEDIEKKINEHAQLEKSIHDATLELERLKAKKQKLFLDKKDAERLLKDAESELAEAISYDVSADDDAELDKLRASLNELENKIDILDAQRIAVAGDIARLQADNERLIKDRDKHKYLLSKWRIYEAFIDACSKKGIPAQIIDSQLPAINAEIEKRLAGIVDFTVSFEKDKNTNATDIFLDYGDSKRILETGSGMEKMIASLAIRAALLNASTLPRPDFLIIDEGFGALDPVNVEACSRFLASLKEWFERVIIITHVEALKDIADNIVEIKRRGHDSYVDV